jgi:hypothetical protein
MVTWTTRLSADTKNMGPHLEGIKEYKKKVIKALQEGVKDKTLMQRASRHPVEQISSE